MCTKDKAIFLKLPVYFEHFGLTDDVQLFRKVIISDLYSDMNNK